MHMHFKNSIIILYIDITKHVLALMVRLKFYRLFLFALNIKKNGYFIQLYIIFLFREG